MSGMQTPISKTSLPTQQHTQRYQKPCLGQSWLPLPAYIIKTVSCANTVSTSTARFCESCLQMMSSIVIDKFCCEDTNDFLWRFRVALAKSKGWCLKSWRCGWKRKARFRTETKRKCLGSWILPMRYKQRSSFTFSSIFNDVFFDVESSIFCLILYLCVAESIGECLHGSLSAFRAVFLSFTFWYDCCCREISSCWLHISWLLDDIRFLRSLQCALHESEGLMLP